MTKLEHDFNFIDKKNTHLDLFLLKYDSIKKPNQTSHECETSDLIDLRE